MGAEKHLSIVISFNGHGNSNETTVSGIRTQKPTPLVTVDVARQRSFLLKDHKQGGYSYSLQNFFIMPGIMIIKIIEFFQELIFNKYDKPVVGRFTKMSHHPFSPFYR